MGVIKNYKELTTNKRRKQALDIIEAGIDRVNPRNLLTNAVSYNETFNSVIVYNRHYDLLKGRIFVVGGGKAVGYMAEALEEIIGPENITAGCVNCTDDKYKTKKIKVMKASHPLPDKNGVRGVEKMLALKDQYKIGEKDLVIFLISGGGSALMPSPVDGVSLKEKQETTQRLLECGANIKEINTVRKHLSKIKGGQLGRHFAPARVVTFIISDVVGNDLDVVASGPAVPDPTTFKDAYNILFRYELLPRVPASVAQYIEKSSGLRPGLKVLVTDTKTAVRSHAAGAGRETPKTLTNCDNYIIGNVSSALEAMAHKAKLLGLEPIIVTTELTGETEAMAVRIAREIILKKYDQYNVILYGGETVPKLPLVYGRGGRNQHYAAASMFALEKKTGEWAMASMATDGVDYHPDAAGAIIDDGSLKKARGMGLRVIEDYIDKYDTNALFRKLGNSLIATGSTGTNVGDVVVYMT